MLDDERTYAVRRLLFEYVRSPSLRHIRDPYVLQRLASDIVKAVPESYLLGDRALYLDAWLKVREAMSPDGLVPERGPATALAMLQRFDKEVAGRQIDLAKIFSNEFVRKADLKFPRG